VNDADGLPQSETRGSRDTERDFDPRHFFSRFDRFVKSSETTLTSGSDMELHRLNARYTALIHSNRHLIKDAQVLDLASHDGRFSFAALQNDAKHVVGIEHKPRLARSAQENMRFYDVLPSRYEFIVGDVFDVMKTLGPFDVVFCFGLLYHIMNPLDLLSMIAELEPRWLIIDSSISVAEGAVIELHDAAPGAGEVGYPPPAGCQLEGYPSKAGLEAMLSSLGWTFEYFDWRQSGLTEQDSTGPYNKGTMFDYRAGRRVTAVVSCGERYPHQMREDAVQSVIKRYPGFPRSLKQISTVASEVGMTPQALAVWVHKAERSRKAQIHSP
jgi:hypothetical protein